MIRMESDLGWWLITHVDHARLAGALAEAWGNTQFRKPEPRARVLHAVAHHDDGWMDRDAHPVVTREGRPSAFSTELVGKYTAFEEMDLEEFLEVRERAVKIIAEQDAYAGLLVSMHTYSLLTEHADPSTITRRNLLLLDSFLVRQRRYQSELDARIAGDRTLSWEEKSGERIVEHFRLLQACDNLSLLACVAFSRPAQLLHPLPLSDGTSREVHVTPLAERHFRLAPWPFTEKELVFMIPARHVERKFFATSEQLDRAFEQAKIKTLTVTLTK
ncbi:MAG TPA: DUF3891 family protein [Terracidiphilus sp.]|nr:DUF3891 family protein [Terracidiphilus sp.]